jgi:hypothetical protein
MSESITPPDNPFGRLALLIEVPDSDRRKTIDDIADAYAVYLGDVIPGGCMIYGLYRGKWIANVSARWLMTQFVTAARQMAASEFSNRGAWQQACNRVIELVEMDSK